MTADGLNEIHSQALRCSPACERNAEAIGNVLKDWLSDRRKLLEIGSGTGQHAAYLIDELPGLQWQPTDLAVDKDTIDAWSSRAQSTDRILAPQNLDVTQRSHWQTLGEFDCVFTANTLHIMSWSAVTSFFANVGHVLSDKARLAIYGPFHDAGKATSESNERFDADLRAAGIGMGIRDRQAVQALAASAGFLQLAHYQMPANNQMLVWQKKAQS